MATERQLDPGAANPKPTPEELVVPAGAAKSTAGSARTATQTAAQTTADAARAAATLVEDLPTAYQAYAQALSRTVELSSRLYLGWLESAWRFPLAGLQVWRYALEQATQPEVARTQQTIAQNVARYAVDQWVETQRQTGRLVETLTQGVTAGEEAIRDVTRANSRLAQTGIQSLNGTR